MVNYGNPYMYGAGSYPYYQYTASPVQQPVQQQASPVYQQPTQAQPQQTMMPVIQTSIIQVNDISEVERFQIANGQSQMFISKDDAHIYVKSATANGSAVETYNKDPPPKAPEYVTVDQLKAMFKELGLVKEAGNESV